MDLETILKVAKALDSSGARASDDCKCDEIKIAILQRGWVMVGRYGKSGPNCHLEDAAVVRSWGTSKGIGEIAINGPTDNTKLDPCGKVSFHELTTVAILDCDQGKWKKHIK